MKLPSIDIIIPNWNGKALLEGNLPHVQAACEPLPTPQKRIVVIDDGSTDESVEFLRSTYPDIILIINERNIGFHRSVNKAAAASAADIVLLLNSDMEPHPESIFHLYKHFFHKDHIFAASGKIYSADKKTFLYGNRGGIFTKGHFILTEKPEDASSQTLFACGGGGAFDRQLFLELGGFDTLFYPFYYEEQDLSYRALKRGFHIHYEPASIMYHQVQATIGKKLKRTRIRLISARNNYLFIIKNITDPVWTLHFILCTPLGIVKSLLHGNLRFLIAFLMAIPRIPRAFLARWREKKYHIKTDREIFKEVGSEK